MTISLVNPDLPASLSAAESAELAARLRALAESGLALEGGLRALAEEASSSRLAEVLRELAARLEKGESLEQAIAAPACRLPVVLRGLILAGIQCGRLPEVLEQFTNLNRQRQELRRRIASTFTYPAALLGVIAILLILCRTYVAEDYKRIFQDFGMKLPELTEFYFTYSGAIGWTIFGFAATTFLVPLAAAFLRLGSWTERAMSLIPILGPAVRHEQYVQFTRLMATLLGAAVPLPDALSLASIAMRGTMLGARCRAAEAAVAAGGLSDEAFARAGFLDSLTCFVDWGQKKNALRDAFSAAADVFEERAKSQASLLKMIVLPLAYLFIVIFIAVTIAALLLPFLQLTSMTMSVSTTGWLPPGANSMTMLDAVRVGAIPAFLLGIFVLMLARWYGGPAPGDRKPIALSIIRACSWIIIVAAIFAGICLAPPESVVAPELVVIFVVCLTLVIAMAYGKKVAAQRYAMLTLLGVATDRSMVLEDVFAAFGHEQGGWMGRRCKKLSHQLVGGVPLPKAVDSVPGVLPPDAEPLLNVGHDTGALPDAIRQAIATRDRFEPLWQAVLPRIVYICLFPGLTIGMLVFMAFIIVPQFERVLRDFNLSMPHIATSPFGALRASPLVWVLLAAAWLISTGLASYAALRYAGLIRWDLPGTAWLSRRRHTAVILDALALAAERQKPVADAVMQLATVYQPRNVARRLFAAHGAMQAGENDLESLRRYALIGQADLALLKTALRIGNFAWAARELAESQRRRMMYRIYALVQAFFPPLIIGYGLVVAVIGMALFLPLIAIIQNLSSIR